MCIVTRNREWQLQQFMFRTDADLKRVEETHRNRPRMTQSSPLLQQRRRVQSRRLRAACVVTVFHRPATVHVTNELNTRTIRTL